EAALAALHVNAFAFPGGIPVVGHDGVDGSGRVALPGNPHLFAGRVLRQRDREALLWREAHDGTEARRPVTVENMERRNIGREGIAWQLAAIQKAVEKLAGTGSLLRAFLALFGRILRLRIVIGFTRRIRLARSRPDGVIDRSQAIVRHFGKKALAVPRREFHGNPRCYAAAQPLLVVAQPG